MAAAADDNGGGPAAKRARLLGDDAIWRPESRHGRVNVIEANGRSCTHEVVWPAKQGAAAGGGGGDGSTEEEQSLLPPPPRPGPPARTYPFTLDPFQQTAINCLEAGHNVLVAAHTSAGKTVVAEYAFAMALRDGARVIYTSPLKALSNQKFRELKELFGDVGLMTGDVTIDPTASCLVMTTEILRSMLYRGSEVVREAAIVVHDEVHYLRDAERGVVWEEAIALTPPGARMAFLSATLPNAAEFAGWVAATHGSPVHVVYTDYRPTPLQHFIFPAGGDGLYMVVDEAGTFRDDNFQQAVAQIAGAGADGGSSAAGKGGADKKPTAKQAAEDDMARLVRMVLTRGYDPLIVFSFSKREVEDNAAAIRDLDLADEAEKDSIEKVYRAATDGLSDDDRRLPQVVNLLPLLRRGVGVHHSGLLPVLKEVVELLFAENLLKVLFATETFSTGLNMPAKTVAFTRARKFDGAAFRWVSSGEYIQMSGRAGRRGKDDRGVVILMLDARMEPAVAKAMIKGAPDALTSAFSLRYSMLLALARVDGASPEALMERSFRQWAARAAAPRLAARAEALAARRDAVRVEDEGKVEELLGLLEQRAALGEALRAATVALPELALRFLQPGRLVRVAAGPPDVARPLPRLGPTPPGAGIDDDQPDDDSQEQQQQQQQQQQADIGTIMQRVDGSVWGVLISFEKAGKPKQQPQQQQQDDDGDGSAFQDGGSAQRFVVDVLVAVDPATLPRVGGTGARALPALLPPGSPNGEAHAVTLPLEHLAAISSVRMRLPSDLRLPSARASVLAATAEVIRRQQQASGSGGAGAGPPLLDPERDLRADGRDVNKLARRLESVEGRIASHPCASALDLAARLGALQAKRALAAAARAARREAKAASGLVLGDELRARQRLLRRLGYVDAEGLVTSKGRVAADLQSGDELVLAELIFSGAFNALPPDQVAALASCFVWSEKNDGGVRLPNELQQLLRLLQATARRVGKAAAEAKVPLDPQEYVESFRPELMQAVAMWARGQRFAEVHKVAGVYEGSLVRAIRRLDELLRQASTALRGVGDAPLADRFEEARTAIRRDVVFLPSLFL